MTVLVPALCAVICSAGASAVLPLMKKYVIICLRPLGRRHCRIRQAVSPEREVMAMFVTYETLFAYSMVIVAVISLVIAIIKK